MNKKVNITTDLRVHPNLRKLARALLLLAQRQLETDQLNRPSIKPVPPKAVKPETGDAA